MKTLKTLKTTDRMNSEVVKSAKAALTGAAVLLAACNASAFQSVSYTVIIPNDVTLPSASGLTISSGWDASVDYAFLNFGSAQMSIPTLGQAFINESIPLDKQGPMLQVIIQTAGVTKQEWIFDNEALSPVSGTVTFNNAVKISHPVGFTAGDFLTLPLTVSDALVAVGADSDATADFTGSDSAFGTILGTNSSITTLTAPGDLNFFQTGVSNIIVPVIFDGSAGSASGGNYGLVGQSYGAAMVTITYQYVPESSTGTAACALAGIVAASLTARRLRKA